MRKNPPLTVLITTRDRRDILEKTLWYIYETSEDGERNIWIWDNASTDDTAAFLGTMVGWPGVRVFRSKVGCGVAGSRRRLLPAVETPYIFTLDDDWWILNRGWASAVVRVLEAESTIHQVALGPTYDSSNDFGVSHVRIARPFFRVPPILPIGRAVVDAVQAPEGCAILDVVGERVVLPASGSRLPFSCSGGAAAWRTADVLPFVKDVDLYPIIDLREAWGVKLAERGTREATIVGYGALHPSPGPLWHLGHCEGYWEERCRFAPETYERSGAQQRRWLETARVASGWGCPLDDPDEVLR